MTSDAIEQPPSHWPDTEKFNWLCRHATRVDAQLEGYHGRLGLVGKVAIIWHTYVWLLCAFSGALGSLITYLILRR